MMSMDGDTVTVFDAARAEVSETIRQALRDAGVSPGRVFQAADAVLVALLAARSSTTCPNRVCAADHDDCPICDGSGTVPGGPLLLALLMESGTLAEVPLEARSSITAFTEPPIPGVHFYVTVDPARAREST